MRDTWAFVGNYDESAVPSLVQDFIDASVDPQDIDLVHYPHGHVVIWLRADGGPVLDSRR